MKLDGAEQNWTGVDEIGPDSSEWTGLQGLDCKDWTARTGLDYTSVDCSGLVWTALHFPRLS